MVYRHFTSLTALFLIIVSPIFLLAQNKLPAAEGQTAQNSLSGQLLQKDNQQPLPFATVILYQTKDSSMAANTLTDDAGNFSFQPEAGNYYLEFSYMGFTTKRVENIQAEPNFKAKKLGSIFMEADAVAIEEVEVTVERSQMQLKLDRRIFNVGKDLTNAGNSAADILDRVPSVSVDPEGNISLRGSQSVRILVNGKPSGLLSAGDTEALVRMQGDIIQSVEVITNPSARYEAEGEAGIINIILKKNQEKGVNGSFGLTLGYPQNYGASYNLNFRRKNLNFFSNFGLDYRKSPGGGNSTQRFFNDGQLTDFFTSKTDQLRGGFGGYLQGGADWNINERNILTGSLLYRRGQDENIGSVEYRDFDGAERLLNTTLREIEEGQEDHNLEAALSYKKSFDDPDRSWTIDFNYILDNDTELADYIQSSDDAAANTIQKSSNTEDESNLLIQTDYIYPIGEKSKIEGGLRTTLRTVDNDFFVEEQDQDGNFNTSEDFDDQLKYTENIFAAYILGGHEFGPFGLQLGLRTEYSDITAALLRSETSNDQNYLSFFPSASFSYQITEEEQFQLSYSRRLSRPYFRDLLPFSNFNNPRNNGIGNPNLRPEFTNSFELGFLRYFANGSLLSSIYYRQTQGVIEELTLPGENGTTIDYPVNLSTRDAYGLELSFSYDLTSWWDLTSDVNFFRALVNGEFEGVDYSSDTYTWSGALISKVALNEAIDFQASFDYNGPRRTTQGRRLSSYAFDIAAALDLFEGRGTLTLAGRDLFNTRKRRTIIDLPNYQSETVFQWRQTRQVVLTFNYRLNQDKSKN